MLMSRVTGAALVTLCALAVAVAPAFANGRPLKADLTGAAEVPGPGDPDGSGTAKLRLNQGKGRICYKIEVSNVTLPATGAHIHSGAAGESGDVVVELGAPDATGVAAGCVEGLDKWLVKSIRKHAADYYVNVHTSDFLDGAVRGQLAKFAPGRP